MTKIDLFSLSIFILFVLFCTPGTHVFYNNWEKIHLWSNNQLSCGILMKIFTMRAGDYDWIINYDWPKEMRKNNSKLNFMKNPWVSLISCGRLKISKCSISLAQLGECSKSKVRPLIEIIMKSSSVKLLTLTKNSIFKQ